MVLLRFLSVAGSSPQDHLHHRAAALCSPRNRKHDGGVVAHSTEGASSSPACFDEEDHGLPPRRKINGVSGRCFLIAPGTSEPVCGPYGPRPANEILAGPKLPAASPTIESEVLVKCVGSTGGIRVTVDRLARI